MLGDKLIVNDVKGKTFRNGNSRGFGCALVVGLAVVLIHITFGIDEYTRRGSTVHLSEIQQILLYPLFGSVAIFGGCGLAQIERSKESKALSSLHTCSKWVIYASAIALLLLYFASLIA